MPKNQRKKGATGEQVLGRVSWSEVMGAPGITLDAQQILQYLLQCLVSV